MEENDEGGGIDINDFVREESNIGQAQPYENGKDQFPDDGPFSTAQTGAVVGPIMAGIGTIFCLIELCFCIYPYSWVPTAFFLFMAFTFQIMTVFLFTSEDFW